MNNRIKYKRRVRKVRKLTLIRNLFLCCGMSLFLPMVLLCESLIGMMLFVICLVSMGTAAYIEYYIINHLIHGDDIKFNPFFTWNVDLEDRSYATWLQRNHRYDTPYNWKLYVASMRR